MRKLLFPAGFLAGMALVVALMVSGAPKPDNHTASRIGRPVDACSVEKEKPSSLLGVSVRPANPCPVPRDSTEQPGKPNGD